MLEQLIIEYTVKLIITLSLLSVVHYIFFSPIKEKVENHEKCGRLTTKTN